MFVRVALCLIFHNRSNRYLHEEYKLRKSDLFFVPHNISTLVTSTPPHPMTSVADPLQPKERGRTPDALKDLETPSDETPGPAAWDPRSKTPPLPRTYFDKPPSPPKTPPPPYWAADPRLDGKKFRVKVDGQGWNGQIVEVTQAVIEDKIVLQCKFEQKIRHIEPSLATAIAPSLARAAGRQLVISGDNFGKYIRRINTPKGSNKMNVVAVRKKTDGEEIVGWDRFQITPGELTAAVEEVDEKTANTSLFNTWKKSNQL